MVRTKLTILIIISISLIFSSTYQAISQAGGTAVPFLMVSPSASISGMGSAGVAMPQEDATSISFNPAYPGLISRSQNLSIVYSPVEWGGGILKLDNFGILLGYDLSNHIGIPLSLGAGYLRQKMDLGEFIRTSAYGQVLGRYKEWESADNITLSGSLDYWVKIGFGFTYKHIISNLTNVTDFTSVEGKANAMDFGVLVSIPAIKDLSLLNKVTLDCDLNFGYALQNLFDNLLYRDEVDPLPRMDRIGYSVNAKFNYELGKDKLTALGLDWSVETNDLLVKRDSLGFKYLNPMSGINLFDNMIALKESRYAEVCFGWRITLLDIFRISGGRETDYYDRINSSGFEISSNGIFKILNQLFPGSALEYINEHFILNYCNSTRTYKRIDNSGQFEYKYMALNLILKNFDIF